jgi:ribonuclease HII
MHLLNYEIELLNKGIKCIAGVDEAGRGPIAGPLVVAAVILDIEKIVSLHEEFTKNDVSNEIYDKYSQINDSKKVSPKKRGVLRDFIINEAISYSIAEIPVEVIDAQGIGEANQIGFLQAIENIATKPNHILTDHFEITKITKEHQTNITKGDTKSISIAAASILAKEHRDQIMRNAHNMYPQYSFEQHKGYGTKKHQQAIIEHGPCPMHRKSFEPTKSLLLTL